MPERRGRSLRGRRSHDVRRTIPCNTHGGLLSFAHSGDQAACFTFTRRFSSSAASAANVKSAARASGWCTVLARALRPTRPRSSVRRRRYDQAARRSDQAAASSRRRYGELLEGVSPWRVAFAALPGLPASPLLQQGLCRDCGSERLEHRPASGRERCTRTVSSTALPDRHRTTPRTLCCWWSSRKGRA